MNPAPQPTDHTPGPAARAPLAAAEVGPSAPPKKGRPRKSTADLRTDQFRIRVTPKEKRRIEREAQKAGLSASDYLRRRALGQPVVARADSDAERQLKRIGGNLNQVARRVNQAGAAGLEGEVRAVLSEIREAIETLRRGTP